MGDKAAASGNDPKRARDESVEPDDVLSERAKREEISARLASIIEHSNDAILAKDLTGTVISWNKAAERMYGYPAEEMVGQKLDRLLPPDRKNEVMEIVDRIRRGEDVEHFQTVRQRRDGERISVDLTVSPILDTEGEIVGASVIARNITDQLDRERAVLRSETRLQIAKDAAGLGIYEWNIVTGIIAWDRRIRAIWGIDREEVVTFETFAAGLHPDDRDSTQQAIDEALDPDGNGRFEAEYRVIQRGTGAMLWIRATGLATFERRQPLYLVGAVQDVTEMRRMVTSLEQADRRKDEFLATLGHELRNPLSAIMTSVECMRRGAGDPDSLYDLIVRQAEHMTSLMNDLLDIGRVTRGDVRLRRERLQLADQIDLALKTLRTEIEAKGHEVEVSIAPPDLVIVADPIRLEQILINLVGNAVKYMLQSGTITIDAGVVGDSIEIAIRDTGIGLPDEGDATRIFDLFYQARKGSGGLGIGLNLVKSLVELHGGKVTVHSEGANRGSTFRVTFPARAVTKPSTPPSDTALPTDLQNLRVLVVDDHEDALRAVGVMVANYCETRTAISGKIALEEARRFRPQLVLLDLALPDMNGFEIAAAIREMPGLERVRIVAMTGFGDSETTRQVEEAEFDGHVLKPIPIRSLLDIFRSTLEGANGDTTESA